MDSLVDSLFLRNSWFIESRAFQQGVPYDHHIQQRKQFQKHKWLLSPLKDNTCQSVEECSSCRIHTNMK